MTKWYYIGWYYIGLSLFLIALVGSTVYEDYSKTQCRIESVKAGKSADDIQKICK
jgi:hypothetical protein